MKKDKTVSLLESINNKLDRVLESQTLLILKDWHWPRNPRRDKVEYDCPHGIGHGDMHGCDGCCRHESFKQAEKRRKHGKR